jgi:hypothetical protein
MSREAAIGILHDPIVQRRGDAATLEELVQRKALLEADDSPGETPRARLDSPACPWISEDDWREMDRSAPRAKALTTLRKGSRRIAREATAIVAAASISSSRSRHASSRRRRQSEANDISHPYSTVGLAHWPVRTFT